VGEFSSLVAFVESPYVLMRNTRGPACRQPLWGGLCVLLWILAGSDPSAARAAIVAEKVSSGQKAAALEFLNAVATGDPQAVAFALHPDDLQALRMRLLNLLHEEAKRGDSTIRARLFGQAKPLDEIDHLTNTAFYATLADRLVLASREYSDAEGIAAIPDKDGKVQVLIRGKQPREHGKIMVVNVVTVKPYGKDWKAALPSEIEAQIDDLIEGRHLALASTRSSGSSRPSRPGSGTSAPQPGIVELLASSEKLLSDGKCDEYYAKQMSPNFRRVTGKKALDALVNACQNSLGTREMLLSTIHLVRALEPHYEYEGQRAVYDLAGQGLPYDHFTVEQVDKKWYIAE
jgi:hypothetical protein